MMPKKWRGTLLYLGILAASVGVVGVRMLPVRRHRNLRRVQRPQRVPDLAQAIDEVLRCNRQGDRTDDPDPVRSGPGGGDFQGIADH